MKNRLSRDLPLAALTGEQFSAAQVLTSVMPSPAEAKRTDAPAEAGQ
jgi:hypothetical protein